MVTFTWARRMAKITNFDRDTFLIHTLELKLRLLECSPYVCIGKPCICNVSTFGVRYLETRYVDDPLPNIAIWMPIFIVWPYYHTWQLCGAIRTIFFPA